MESFEIRLPKNMVDQDSYGISAVALIPVVAVPNHNTHFRLVFGLINVIVDAIANARPKGYCKSSSFENGILVENGFKRQTEKTVD